MYSNSKITSTRSILTDRKKNQTLHQILLSDETGSQRGVLSDFDLKKDDNEKGPKNIEIATKNYLSGGPLSRRPASSSSIAMSPKMGKNQPQIFTNKTPGAKVKFQIDPSSPNLRSNQ